MGYRIYPSISLSDHSKWSVSFVSKVFIGEYHSVHGDMLNDLTRAIKMLWCSQAFGRVRASRIFESFVETSHLNGVREYIEAINLPSCGTVAVCALKYCREWGWQSRQDIHSLWDTRSLSFPGATGRVAQRWNLECTVPWQVFTQIQSVATPMLLAWWIKRSLMKFSVCRSRSEIWEVVHCF